MIKLETEEHFCLLNALNVTIEHFMKSGQHARAEEARQLHDLLFWAGSNSVQVDIDSMQSEGLKDVLMKREARLKGDGAVVIAFPATDY